MMLYGIGTWLQIMYGGMMVLKIFLDIMMMKSVKRSVHGKTVFTKMIKKELLRVLKMPLIPVMNSGLMNIHFLKKTAILHMFLTGHIF